ncbi:ABC transporter ATP-binding protein [Photobacterium atrarenae]|uniref:ATP-binding cassette domain-containing protein n=1 Tax=Photobacterium atrarenae TaxID=865757 RepID=A0ABY5GDR6_9GAMM|nr:ATP-binding cassette domain-containing protein [Photobacterium atrarenae]UTV26935.1 ATP-binding cassette domain-containing protein [Photobacterium atrarenae]
MAYISAHQLGKEFFYYRKQSGLMASLKNLWGREQLSKLVVRDLSFEIEQGEIVAFIGPNGAGKTTTMKMLSGILHPSTGHARVMGYVPWAREKAFKRKFSIIMGQKQQLWPDLPAIDSFELNKRIYEIKDRAYQQTLGELSEILNVRHLLDIQVRRLSLGERMKLELIAALLHQPEVIFLDEPTLGLDFLSQRAILAFLKTLAEEKRTTMLLTSHNMVDIATLCQRGIVISGGQLVYDGSLEALGDVVGAKRHLHVYSHTPIEKQVFAQYGRIIAADRNEIVIEISKAQSQTILARVLAQADVADIKIKELPLEHCLESLYLAQKVPA